MEVTEQCRSGIPQPGVKALTSSPGKETICPSVLINSRTREEHRKESPRRVSKQNWETTQPLWDLQGLRLLETQRKGCGWTRASQPPGAPSRRGQRVNLDLHTSLPQMTPAGGAGGAGVGTGQHMGNPVSTSSQQERRSGATLPTTRPSRRQHGHSTRCGASAYTAGSNEFPRDVSWKSVPVM